MELFPDLLEGRQFLLVEVISRTNRFSIEVVFENSVDSFAGLVGLFGQVVQKEVVEVACR